MRASTGIMFVAATTIGSGMIALPITLAKIGIIPSIVLMLSIWFIIYYTSLVNLELNLQSGKGMALGQLCERFSGKRTKFLGNSLLKLLSYSLLCAYISIGSSIIEKILSVENLSLWYGLLLLVILYCPAATVKKINNFLFLLLMGVIGILLLSLVALVNWSSLPLIEEHQFLTWTTILPVLFTSFGFQVIFHTLTDYYKCNGKTLKIVFFWGSLLPAIVYIIWSATVIGTIHSNNSEFYKEMVSGGVSVSDLVSQLSLISKNSLIQELIMWLSFLAIVTSAIGVGLGLVGSIQEVTKVSNRILPPLLVVLPPLLIVWVIPNAFLKILGFAGMILSLIAIIIPIYLLTYVKKDFVYSELKNKYLIILSMATGILIVICGIFNLFS
jgi:tyrosine-specific transport protein